MLMCRDGTAAARLAVGRDLRTARSRRLDLRVAAHPDIAPRAMISWRLLAACDH
jgi:hypothetical protein